MNEWMDGWISDINGRAVKDIVGKIWVGDRFGNHKYVSGNSWEFKKKAHRESCKNKWLIF